jgi:hypothetical protein
MAINMKEIINQVNLMDKASICGKMDVNMLVDSLMGLEMDMECGMKVKT